MGQYFMTEDLVIYESYFQKSKTYYLDKWIRYRKGQKFSFNVFAFLFGFFWFLYRKMYIEAIILIAALVIEGFLQNLIWNNNSGPVSSTIINISSTLFLATIIGFLGNYFYLRKAVRTVESAKIKYSDKEQLKMNLRENGGVSFHFLIALIIIIFSVFMYNTNFLSNELNTKVVNR